MSKRLLPYAPESVLSQTQIRGSVWDDSRGVLRVDDAFSFLQAIGYLKYKLDGPVLFRGQHQVYPAMLPSLFRGSQSDQSVRTRCHQVNTFLRNQKAVFVRRTPDNVKEPLLQHYGFNTRWLDLVDNVWIALWFACHRAEGHSAGKVNTLHFRKWEVFGADLDAVKPPEHVYVFAVNAGRETLDNSDGAWTTEGGAQLVDLRRAAPSMYLRPHAQHGWLLRRAVVDSMDEIDLSSFVVGILEIPVRAALAWLGDGHLLSVRALFPSAKYDYGYSRFLKQEIKAPPTLGMLNIIEP